MSAFVNKNFEPAWESVRPVPIVRIDFGQGKVITRTLHGNIASYVCDADGRALDILPGIYEPATYLDRLNQFRLLHNYFVTQVGQQEKDKVAEKLRKYHSDQAKALGENQPPARFVNMADMAKVRIEGRLKAMLVAGNSDPGVPATPAGAGQKKDVNLYAGEDLSSWAALAEDTKLNESVRKRQVHEMLARTGPAQPNALKKRLYREVLHADLDDPYLGLGKTLFASYPFAGEERR